MGKRNRGRGRLATPTAEYRDAEGNLLVLRAAMSPPTRRRYASTLHDQKASTDDSWQRAVELLFERLAERWVVHDVPTEGQQELLLRYRAATPGERRWIRDVLREHLSEHFPEMEIP